MIRFKNWIIPTPVNNYKAYLITKPMLVIYVVLLLVLNFWNGYFPVVKSFALFDESEITRLHNRERQKQNLPPLTVNRTLEISAREKGLAMIESDCWSHYCPDGKSPWDFFRDAGYTYTFAGENLAEGFSSAEAMMQAWMNSKTHRENILKQDYTEIGIALVTGNYQGVKSNTLVVVHFGTPKQARVVTDVISPPIITQPLASEEISNPLPEIKGSYKEDVVISLNGERSGRISPEGGIFTYRPSTNLEVGEHTVFAADYDNAAIASAPVKFRVAGIQNTRENTNEQVTAASGQVAFAGLNTVQLLGIAIVILLTILFFLDFIVIQRTNLEHNLKLKSQAHLHLPTLIILLVLSLMGNLNGMV